MMSPLLRNLLVGARLLSLGAMLAPTLFQPAVAQGGGSTPAAVNVQQLPGWTPVAESLLKKITDSGQKIGYPGGTAGLSVDRLTGDLTLVVPDQGLWRSSDGGKTFARVDGGKIGGRCETGSALQADPAGKRLACFMLDGASGITLDDSKSWSNFAQHGRGWDFGTVDWSVPSPQMMLAVHHESGQELYTSADVGKSWKLLGKDFTAVGIFNATTWVASKGSGILRSTDGGATWNRVSETTPTGRVLRVLNGVGTWITPEGLLVSKDLGATWQRQGSIQEAAWGPFFGKDENQITVAGRRGQETGIWRTDDGGKIWRIRAPFPAFAPNEKPDWTPSKQWAAGWFTSFGWDWKRGQLYASHMGHPALVVELK